MKNEDILSKYGPKQPFSETVFMLLSNCIDYGSDKGGLISKDNFGKVEEGLKMLMKITWDYSQNACTCGTCDFCNEYGPDTFERFIEEFPDILKTNSTLLDKNKAPK